VGEKRGIILVTGPIGTGKTTLSHLLMNDWRQEPEAYIVGHVTDPSPRTPAAFLRLIMLSYGLDAPRNLLDIKAVLREFLVEQYKSGRTVILILDEAQTISGQNLGTLQYLSNEQTQTAKLIQIVLFAQPNFSNKLTHYPALKSRIAGASTLDALALEDSVDMLRHRMDIAGGDFDTIFPLSTHKALYNATGGVPRDLCILCDSAMINAYVDRSKVVSTRHVERALADLNFKGWGAK
jgi:type II secretory pathway predicted ATPase ExeA